MNLKTRRMNHIFKEDGKVTSTPLELHIFFPLNKSRSNCNKRSCCVSIIPIHYINHYQKRR